MLRVTIYTVAGQPSFEVSADTTAAQLRAIVEDKFGWVGIGVSHTWVGVLV